MSKARNTHILIVEVRLRDGGVEIVVELVVAGGEDGGLDALGIVVDAESKESGKRERLKEERDTKEKHNNGGTIFVK